MNTKNNYIARVELINKIKSMSIQDGELIVVLVNNNLQQYWSDLSQIWIETFDELKKNLKCPNAKILFVFNDQVDILNNHTPNFIQEMNKLGWYHQDQLSD